MYLVTAGILACLVCSAFFSAAEMCYSSCNRIRLENSMEDGDKAAKRACFITDRFEDALSAILIGNNLANIAGSSLASVLVILITDSSEKTWIATVVMTVLVIIFGETAPKMSAKKRATSLALKYSLIIRILMAVLTPVIRLVTFLIGIITSGMKEEEPEDADEAVEELQSIIETAEDEDVLDEDRSELVQAAIDFPDISASEVMTARVDLDAIDIEDERENILNAIFDSPHSRLPVYEGSIDNIIGVLYLNRYLKALTDNRDADIRAYLMPACYVYKTMRLPSVLNELREAKQHLAVVSDEYGGTLGVVTMEDVLEQIVGDIWDENDVVEPEIIRHEENEYVLDGDMTISDFAELAGLDEDALEAESETLGGWCVEVLDAFPKENQSFEYENLKITVLAMDGRRVEKVKINIAQ